jgi:hypothetical protein
MTVATLRSAPASKSLSFQLIYPPHQFLILQKVLLKFLNASVSAVIVHFEGIGPDASGCTWNIVVLPTNVDVIGILKPIQQVFIADLPKRVNFHIGYTCLLWLLDVFHFCRFLLRNLFLCGNFYGLLFFLSFKQCFLNVTRLPFLHMINLLLTLINLDCYYCFN